jgi:dTDP-4-dehydrorhamnose reductase
MGIWDAANEARREGADVRAVTIWSLLGSFDWNSLVTRDEGHYEPGVFDIYDGEPRETLLGEMVRALTARGAFEHPYLAAPGWWQRERRADQQVA